jgi:hypothetical protein
VLAELDAKGWDYEMCRSLSARLDNLDNELGKLGYNFQKPVQFFRKIMNHATDRNQRRRNLRKAARSRHWPRAGGIVWLE